MRRIVAAPIVPIGFNASQSWFSFSGEREEDVAGEVRVSERREEVSEWKKDEERRC